MPKQEQFTFDISLSVLDHLGRNLYRSFATVLGEAISNAWDADAENVWIDIDRGNDNFSIKDDGVGMSADDFQQKFLRIGYSKRKDGSIKSAKKRPYIGRKGIGKLALLSCAEKIAVISKKSGKDYIGGLIDNSGLNKAITEDLTPQQYPLGKCNLGSFGNLVKGHKHGTIIRFEGVKEGINDTPNLLKKIIALYFRFSLLDDSFNIFVDGEKVTCGHLDDLADKTEFVWNVNGIEDPFLKKMSKTLKENVLVKTGKSIKGFIASVKKPRDLKINKTDERVSIDLFVNGRMREKDILKHIPTARVAESYLYGQIHFDGLDDKEDRFTSSREGIVADDPKYKAFLEDFRKMILEIIAQWDDFRRKYREDGDSENETISSKERKSEELFNAVSQEYGLPKESKNRKKVDKWVGDLVPDARYNFTSYAECFISENLIRRFIKENQIALTKEASDEIQKYKDKEEGSKSKGNVSIDIRDKNSDTGYLSMDGLANLVDKKDPLKEACLARDANEYKPIRDAVAHTALLTDAAKGKLTSVYENIKGRIRTLLSEN